MLYFPPHSLISWPKIKMKISYYFRALAVWLLLMFAETIHGTARVFLLVPLVGDFRARQIAVFTGALLIFLITAPLIRWMNPLTTRQCLLSGALWVLLTVCFEVGLGFWVFQMPMSRIAEDYNPLEGGLMPVGLLLMFFTPLAAARWRKIQSL